MQDSVTYESYPTHPLGERESWPASGPIYGLAEFDAKPESNGTIWQRWVTGVPEAQESIVTPSSLPIWY